MNFSLKHNIMTGEDYMAVEDNRHDYHQEIARAAYADMLHDTERNKLYEVGLQKAIQEMHSKGKIAYVLDIGTGSGLLSMMAYRNGADKITACEAFEPIADCAFKVIKNNGMEDKIHIVRKCSTSMTVGKGCDMPRKANILVTEVYDTELIGEGAIPTFEHAHRVLLEKDCIVIPSVANMYVQCISSQNVRNWNIFKNIKLNNLNTVTGDKNNEILVPNSIRKCSGISGVHDLQLDQISQNDFTALSEPIQVFRFDYTGKSPILKSGHSIKPFKALANGNCDAVFMWWDLEMTPRGSEVILSCAPRWAHHTSSDMQWRDHWMQAIYYPLSSILVEHGKEFCVNSFHDEYSLWFDVTLPMAPSTSLNMLEAPPLCTCGAHLVCCRTRIGMLNDHERLSKFTRSMAKIIDSNSICLSISNGSFLPLIAAKLGAKIIFVLEESNSCQTFIESYIETNDIKSIVFIKESQLLDINIFNGHKINLVVAEPYFMQSTLPWHDLYYAYIINKIGIHLSKNVQIIPKECSLKAIAVEFKNLHKIRSVLDTCEGFNMVSFDALIMSSCKKADNKAEPHPLWEYPALPITNSFTLNTFTISKDPLESFMSKKINSSSTIDFLKSFNGVALWMDYRLDDEFTFSNGLESSPKSDQKLNWYPHYRQGVYLIDNPKPLEENQRLTYGIEFIPKTGFMNLEFTVI